MKLEALPLGASFYLYPSTTLYYGAIFIQKSAEQLDKKTSLIIESISESFFRWGCELKLAHEAFRDGFGLVIPRLSIGWVSCIPISEEAIHYRISGCEVPFEKTSAVGGWSHYSFGGGLSLLHTRGIFVSFEYELSVGQRCSIHLGTIRVGLTW